ncbi:MAG: DUF1648 domain-containing protein [Segetibacter sp.]
METRPRIKIELSQTDKLIEFLGWLTLLLLVGLTLYSYSNLPDTIPIHFNGSGQVDNYGSKSTIISLPVIGTVLFIGLTMLNKYPHIFNYPVNITADNAFKQYTTATRIIRCLKFSIALIFTSIVFMTYTTATGKTSGLGTWFLPLTLGLIFIPQTFLLFKSFKAKK